MNLSNAAEKTVWQAAIYARLSCEDGDKVESDSIINQKELIRTYAGGKQDIQISLEYEDDGFTGVNFERPSFQRMLDDIKAGLINCVIVKDLSRLGRNYIEMGKLLERFFPFMGVRFIAINDSYDSLNHNAQTDNLIIPFKNLINDAYCADTSRKIRSQFEVKRKKGDFIGSFATYGYLKSPDNKNKLIIDETVASVIRDIFKWKIDGMSQQGIADRLNEMGILCPIEYKKSIGCKLVLPFNVNSVAKWSYVAVGRILKNDIYIGVTTQGMSTTPNYKIKQRLKKSPEEWVKVERTHSPIISDENFALVNGLLKKDVRIAPGRDNVYIFSGLLYCGDCGQNHVRKLVPDRETKYAYYVCSTHKKGKGCKSHNISEKALQAAVLQTVQLHIRECVKISKILAFIEDMPLHQIDTEKLQRHIETKQAELEKLNSRKLKLYEDFTDGILNKTEYQNFRDIFSAQVEDAEKALVKLRQELDDIVNNSTDKCLWIEHFKKHHDLQDLSRAVVVELIERINVYEKGVIDVHFRYHENFEQALHFIESVQDEKLNEERVGY